MNVSVIIPAYNMAPYLRQTLNSLQAQRFKHWEAIVVDDGSSDETAAIAAAFAGQDERFRLVQQSNQGGSAARNNGIALARGDWFLFLDADDWILERHLERMVARLGADSALDAVHCGWMRVSPGGVAGPEKYAPDVPDMFDLFAQYCAFQPHACLVRGSLAVAVGGFETALQSCQDWDFWQRIARMGARFGAVREALACYRTRPGSTSLDGRRLLADGLRVITQGHSSDDRVPAPAHPTGRAIEHLAGARLQFVAWPAGLVLGAGGDARPLLDALQDDHDPHLSPAAVAALIFESALLSGGHTEPEWAELWPRIDANTTRFLERLEQQSGAPALARQTVALLQNSIAAVVSDRPALIGRTYAIELELTTPLPQRVQEPQARRLHCRLLLAGEELGALELPLPVGVVNRATLANAITQAYAWPILGRFFEQTAYPQLQRRQENDCLSLWRGDLCLIKDLPRTGELSWSEIHDEIGWTVFLQELWGIPTWPGDSFYEAGQDIEASSTIHTTTGRLHVEISEPLPNVATPRAAMIITATVGGAALAHATLPVTANLLRAQEIRAAVSIAAGYELCRLAVRQALLGRPLTGGPPLRRRLQQSSNENSETSNEPVSTADESDLT